MLLTMSLFPWLVAVSPADEQIIAYLNLKVNTFCLFIFMFLLVGCCKYTFVVYSSDVYYSEESDVLHSE
jgi:hypothetical protein